MTDHVLATAATHESWLPLMSHGMTDHVLATAATHDMIDGELATHESRAMADHALATHDMNDNWPLISPPCNPLTSSPCNPRASLCSFWLLLRHLLRTRLR